MREETERWLAPMLKEAQARQLVIVDLMQQASMPAAEAANPMMDWLAQVQQEANEHGDTGLRHGALDWVRFGQLLRDRLGCPY